MTAQNGQRPLFIPLHGVWFDAFERGEKFDEWRRLGPRWNLRTCQIGRRVILSRGYSGRRLTGVISAVAVARAELPGVAALFGAGTECLVITLHAITPLAAT